MRKQMREAAAKSVKQIATHKLVNTKKERVHTQGFRALRNGVFHHLSEGDFCCERSFKLDMQ